MFTNPNLQCKITFLKSFYFFVHFCLTLRKTLSFAERNNNETTTGHGGALRVPGSNPSEFLLQTSNFLFVFALYRHLKFKFARLFEVITKPKATTKVKKAHGTHTNNQTFNEFAQE